MEKSAYRRLNYKNTLFVLAFTVLALIAFFITLGFGVYNISLSDAFSVLLDHLLGNTVDAIDDYYVWDVRLPRAIGALLVGAGLSVAGAVMQNDFKNPLADPYTMGISSGAFLGATLSIVLGISIIPGLTGNLPVVINSFIFSLVPLGIIILVSKFKKLSPVAMILIGIAVMYLFSSITQIILVTAPAESLSSAYQWRVGTLSRMQWDYVPLMVAAVIVLVGAVWLMSGKLNVMYAGDKAVQTFGEKPNWIRTVSLVIVSLLTAAMVCFTGTIGFIGLVGPHVARIFVGSNNRYLIPASAAFGAAFVLIADTIAKVSGPNGLPVGVICSMIGGPLFIWILVKQRKSVWM